jgi:hydroxypyruvate isomerase
MSIRLSVPDWCFYHPDLAPEDYYQRLAMLGITGVEMVDPARWQAARQAGLQILNLQGHDIGYGLNRLEHHAELLPRLRAQIALARSAGIPGVICFSGNRDGLDDATGIAHCAQALRQLAPLAEDAGITLLFEVLCAQGHPDYQADRSAFAFTMVQQVNSPAVLVLYDIYHMRMMGEDVLADLHDHLDLIGHLHVAETPERGIPLAGGHIDYRPIVAQVTAAGYRGDWGLEFIPQGDVFAELSAAVTLFRNYAETAVSR